MVWLACQSKHAVACAVAEAPVHLRVPSLPPRHRIKASKALWCLFGSHCIHDFRTPTFEATKLKVLKNFTGTMENPVENVELTGTVFDESTSEYRPEFFVKLRRQTINTRTFMVRHGV